MSLRFTLLLGIFWSLHGSFAYAAPVTLETVSDLDISFYLGKWNQVAAIPGMFKSKCVKGNSFEFKELYANGTVKVINHCTHENGKISALSGLARANPKYFAKATLKDYSKMEITFTKIFDYWMWILDDDYWVISLGKENDGKYTYSVVGVPKRNYLWIFSRDLSMSEETLRELEVKIREGKYGYDTCKIKITQAGKLNGRDLCSLRLATK